MSDGRCPLCNKTIYYGIFCSNDCADRHGKGERMSTQAQDVITSMISRGWGAPAHRSDGTFDLRTRPQGEIGDTGADYLQVASVDPATATVTIFGIEGVTIASFEEVLV